MATCACSRVCVRLNWESRTASFSDSVMTGYARSVEGGGNIVGAATNGTGSPFTTRPFGPDSACSASNGFTSYFGLASFSSTLSGVNFDPSIHPPFWSQPSIPTDGNLGGPGENQTRIVLPCKGSAISLGDQPTKSRNLVLFSSPRLERDSLDLQNQM